MKVSIFGSSGFIGQHLVNALKGKYSVTEISLRRADWNNAMPKDTQVFTNLVGKAHDHAGTATQEDFEYANVILTKKIFEAFLNSNAEVFIHVSSVAALEEFSSDKPLTENDSCNPVSIYGKTKREAELWLLDQILPQNKKMIILRPPMIHGPGDKGNLGLLYKIISKGIPYPLAAFNNSRSFLSITNFCFYIEQVVEKYKNLDSGIYHIADNEPLSTRDLIKTMKEALDKRIPEIAVPKILVKFIARIGDFLPLPINSKRLKKMTSSLLISNQKINNALDIKKLPETAVEGVFNTVKSFKQ